MAESMTDEYDDALARAELAEGQVDELKLQLDDALGAEEMLEQLTERNLTLSEVRPYPARVRHLKLCDSALRSYDQLWKTSRLSKSSATS